MFQQNQKQTTFKNQSCSQSSYKKYYLQVMLAHPKKPFLSFLLRNNINKKENKKKNKK